MSSGMGMGIPIRIEGGSQQAQPQQTQQSAGGRPQQSQQQRPSVVERLRQLEAEMDAEAAAGAFRLPADRELTDRLGAFLAERYPHADLQITVNSVRRTITTKQQYETETPGMVGLPMEQLQELQRKLMAKISKATMNAKCRQLSRIWRNFFCCSATEFADFKQMPLMQQQ